MIDQDKYRPVSEFSDGERDKNRSAAMLVYILMLFAPLFYVSAVIGVIIAYVYRDDAPEWLASHFQLQVRTFWLGLVLFSISALTLWFLIGKLLILIAFIWYMVRIIKGIKHLNHNRPYPNPTNWGI